MHRALAVVVVLALAAAAVWLVQSGRIAIPPRWNPWAALDIAEVPNALTRFKLARLEHDGAACLAALKQTSFKFREVPDRDTGPDCGFRNAVAITSTEVALASPVTLSCPAAVALALWERHSVQPAAARILGERVARIDHFGAYACRNIYGRARAPRSEHATANAIDVAGFVLVDGRRVRVVKDWRGETPAARFLHEIDADACRYFAAVLGPDYNAAHRDHLHLDRGSYLVCR